jgi:hypothetical protein
MKRFRALSWRSGFALAAWTLSSCAPSGFQDSTSINSVRILATSADTPYAAPGATVNLSVLAVDPRPNPTNSANGVDVPDPRIPVYWLPFVCKDPPGDAYYACFQQFLGKGGGDAGAGAGAGAGADAGAGGIPKLVPGVELPLPNSKTFQFKMPDDAVTAHTPVPGTDAYGIAILFNIACAGHIELLPLDPNNINPQQVPFGCFDNNHNQLGPNDYVFGYTRVYAYAPGSGVTNTNPVIQGIDVEGQPLGFSQDADGNYTSKRLTSSRCTADRRDNCPHVHIGPIVPASSQESYTLQGQPQKEEIWADYFTSFGQVDDGARLLYDSTTGSIGDPSVTDNQWLPPNDPGTGFIWIVVHDNRDGAVWITIPVTVQ